MEPSSSYPMDSNKQVSISSEHCDETIIAGDFNCDPNKGRFFHELSQFAIEKGLHICDVNKLPADTYTYISETNNCSTSWIDHVLSTDADIIYDIRVLYGVTFYDHVPLQFLIRLSPVRIYLMFMPLFQMIIFICLNPT